MGISIVRPAVFAIRPRIPVSWRICFIEPRAPESAIMKMGLYWSMLRVSASVTSPVVFSHSRTTSL